MALTQNYPFTGHCTTTCAGNLKKTCAMFIMDGLQQIAHSTSNSDSSGRLVIQCGFQLRVDGLQRIAHSTCNSGLSGRVVIQCGYNCEVSIPHIQHVTAVYLENGDSVWLQLRGHPQLSGRTATIAHSTCNS
ncbi:hypothetical protein J6590_053860, partial [Homalodisca vitripennis]